MSIMATHFWHTKITTRARALLRQMLLNPWQVGGDAGIDAGKIVSGAFVAVGHQSDQHEIEAVTILLEFLYTNMT